MTAIRKAIAESAHDIGIEFLVPATSPQITDSIAVHYCEEWLDFEIEGDAVVLAGRSSTCGPGYHAFVVDVVDRLARTQKLIFREEGEYLDESDYFRNRDYDALQRYHADWLRGLANMLVERDPGEGAHGQLVTMPVGGISPAVTNGQICTPKGILSLNDFHQIAAAKDGLLMELAAAWFPWWNRTPSASDFVRTAKSLMWVNVPWHPPADNFERGVMSAALQCSDRAKKIDPATDIPTTEMEELRLMLRQSPEIAGKPRDDGIGYRRRTCNWDIGGNWTMRLPGYWYEVQDGDNWGITFSGQFIWVSSFTVERNPVEVIADQPLKLSAGNENSVTVFESSDEEYRHRLSKAMAKDEEGRFTYLLEAARSDGFIIVTFSGDDPNWEKEIGTIARSVR